MSRIFAKEVDRDELLYLREVEHLSNAEIAQRYGGCNATIYNLIGKAPKECNQKTRGVARQPETAFAPIDRTPPVYGTKATEEPEGACLMIERPITNVLSLATDKRWYSLLENELEIHHDGLTLLVPYDQLPVLVREISVVMRHRDAAVRPTNELW